jgi:hypothetical protein
VIPSAYWTRIDLGSGKDRGLVRVRRGMPWPARLPYMPLEVMSILHLLTCISTRTGRCCFTPALLLLYSCFTPAFIYNRAVVLLYLSSCCTPTLLLFCTCCHPVLLKYMHIYTRALLLLDSIFV